MNKKQMLYIDETFYDMVHEYMKEYQKEYKIKISSKDATRIITERIMKAGGLLV